jgi:hypothetical protein
MMHVVTAMQSLFVGSFFANLNYGGGSLNAIKKQMHEQGKQIKCSTSFCFAILVRLPVGITSLETDGESLSQQPFVEQFLV